MKSTIRRAALLAAACMMLAACGSGGGSSGSTTGGPSGSPATTGSTGSSNPTSGGHLTIYTARNKDVTDFVIGEFTKTHPEYKGKIDVINMGAGDIPERVRAEKANPQGDVWWGGTQQSFELAANDNLLTTWQPDFASKIDANYKDAQGRWFGEILFPEVIMTNTNAVPAADAPKDWGDLVQPKWKGKVVIRDVLASGTMQTVYSSMIYRFYKDSHSAQQGYDWLCKLDANTEAYAANPADLYVRMSRQEGVVSIWDLPDILIQKNQHNMPFGFVMPASGAPVVTDGVGVIKGSPNQAGAKEFLSFLFQPSLRAELASKYFEIPTVPLDNPPSWMSDVKIKRMDVEWSVLGQNQQEWMNHWSTKIKGQC